MKESAISMESGMSVAYCSFPDIVKIYCLAAEVKNQSLAGESIAMREQCTIPLHCPQSRKLKIRLLLMLLYYPSGIPTSHGRRNRGAQVAHVRLFTKFVCKVPLFSLHSVLFAREGAPKYMCPHFLNASYSPALSP